MKRFIFMCLLLLPLVSARSQVITKMEYFVDTDPGVKNGTDVPIPPGRDVTANFSINLAGLTLGVHQVVVRACQDDTLWSIISAGNFITVDLGDRPDIVQMEYYVDTGPGSGFATPVAITQDFDVSAVFGINLAGLTIGIHQVVVRVKDSENAWSIAVSDIFFVNPPVYAPITKMEYFIDTDPGYGNGINVPVTAGYDVSSVFPVGTTGMIPGSHILSVRTRDANGVWSIISSTPFIFFDESVANIMNVEYFLDTDPGYGNGTPIVIPPGKNISTGFVIDTTGWGTTQHDVFVRMKNAKGDWSLTNTVMNNNVAINRVMPATTISSGTPDCSDAFQFLVTGGVGNNFLVQNGGSATLIAGHRIHCDPSTKVVPGGYLHAFISPGNYCHSTLKDEPDNGAAPLPVAGTFFRIYPNPATGDVTLEITGGLQLREVVAEVFSLRGERVQKLVMENTAKQTIPMAGLPSGIYFVRVILGDRAVTGKILKR